MRDHASQYSRLFKHQLSRVNRHNSPTLLAFREPAGLRPMRDSYRITPSLALAVNHLSKRTVSFIFPLCGEELDLFRG